MTKKTNHAQQTLFAQVASFILQLLQITALLVVIGLDAQELTLEPALSLNDSVGSDSIDSDPVKRLPAIFLVSTAAVCCFGSLAALTFGIKSAGSVVDVERQAAAKELIKASFRKASTAEGGRILEDCRERRWPLLFKTTASGTNAGDMIFDFKGHVFGTDIQDFAFAKRSVDQSSELFEYRRGFLRDAPEVAVLAKVYSKDRGQLSTRTLALAVREVATLAQLAKLRIESLAQIESCFVDDNAVTVVTNVSGVQLWQELRSASLLGDGSIFSVREVMLQLIQGLGALRAAGITHGLLNPFNIFLRGNGKLMISNFVAATRGPRSCPPSLGLHSYNELCFMHPLVRSNGEPQSHWRDVWSLGCIYWMLLCKCMPVFDGDPALEAKTPPHMFPAPAPSQSEDRHVVEFLSADAKNSQPLQDYVKSVGKPLATLFGHLQAGQVKLLSKMFRGHPLDEIVADPALLQSFRARRGCLHY